MFSENISNEIFSKFFRIWEREKLSAQPPTLTLGASIPCGAPRVPERFDRACARETLASLSTTAMLFLQHGGVNLAGRPPSSMAWSRALRAADSASRIPPFKTLMAVSAAARISSTKQWLLKKSLWPDVSLRLLAHLRAIPYLTSPLEP